MSTPAAEPPTIRPYDWIKQLPPSIMQLDDTPLFGSAPPFPWEQLSHEVASLFNLNTLSIQPIDTQWRSADTLLAGLGSHPLPLYLHFSPLEGSLCWLMDKNDIETLMLLLLTQKPKALTQLDTDFEKGFYQFLIAQTINLINRLDFDKNLSPSVSDQTDLPHQDALCIDVKITLDSKSMMGRVVIPPELRHSWKERYADRKLAPDYNSPLGHKIQVIVHLEAGKTSLSKEEWNEISPGDFILLDHCSFEPGTDKGRIMMTIDGMPMFRARLKQGTLKILEYPLFHAVEAPMNNKSEDDEFDDTEFDEDFEEETFEEGIEEPPQAKEGQPAAAAAEEEVEEEPESKVPPAMPVPGAQKAGLKAEELSINLIIEVGRLQMSIQKLMELRPGNTLDLDIHPEDGVDLVVNGRRVGKGELIKVGDTLGVRVLDLG